jgi:hypothetical protein
MHSVHVFKASDGDRAFERALALGRAHEQEYTNGDGQRVRWRFVEVGTLDLVQVPELDGAEVYSECVEMAEGEDMEFDAVFHPELSAPGQTL